MFEGTNLLETPDLDPPMGDLFSFRTLAETRSVWATPLPSETGAPRHRIIHTRVFTPTGMARIRRLLWRRAPGYHKCGSRQEHDWIVDLRILTLDTPQSDWRELAHLRGLEPTDEDQTFTCDGLETCGLILEIRRCGIDGWWTPWNLAAGAFAVEGTLLQPIAPRQETLLRTPSIDLGGLPPDLVAHHREGQVFFVSPWLKVGFCLGRPGWSYLGLDQEGEGQTGTNLLCTGPGSFHQGLMLSPTGEAPVADPAVRYRFEGTVEVRGNVVTYRVANERTDQRYTLEWTVRTSEITLRVQRESGRTVRAWHSAAWRCSLLPLASPSHILAPVERIGQTGTHQLPALFHAPGQGHLTVRQAGAGSARLEVFRPRERIEWELKVGEEPTPEGDWILPAGCFEAKWHFAVTPAIIPLAADAPAIVRQAARRCGYTGLSFRPDTATLSNNGASMHCPLSMDTWAAQTTRLGPLPPGLSANALLRDSIERWLDGGPGYGAGNLLIGGEIHSAEDEYLMTGTAALLGLAEYLASGVEGSWLDHYAGALRERLEAMQARDLDHDGLIESPYRTGTSGSGQWSTCWYDVVSFGWKDAFSNALLAEALPLLADAFEGTALADWSAPLRTWRARLEESYFETFYNPATGWLAGWVCRDGKQHDHAFHAPNGAAIAAGLVPAAQAVPILRRLLAEIKRVGMPSARYGMPGNLRPIPDADLADIIQGYPFGYYQNGGRTHAQTRHLLRALYRHGLRDEADMLLLELCEGLAHGDVFGGCKSGRDWRYWDDRPCGYEGLLTDQFGVIAVILERYGADRAAAAD